MDDALFAKREKQKKEPPMKKIKIALIGANGQLGFDINRAFKKDSHFEIIPLLHQDIEVTKHQQARQVLTKIKPDVVINTAAYHKTDEVEDNPEKAFLVNSIAQKNLAELAEENKWTLVFFSTDYVFGSEEKRNKPYLEEDIPGPINVYGVSKLAGEYFSRYLCSKHFIIRLSGLFGVAGPSGKGENFVELMIRLGKEKKEVSVVDDQVLAPTYTKNVAENLKELLQTDHYGLYHMTSEGQCSWWRFASEIFKLLSLKVKCHKVDSDFFKTRSKRPSYSVLENAQLKKIRLNKMRDWQENLKLYLKEKKHLA